MEDTKPYGRYERTFSLEELNCNKVLTPGLAPGFKVLELNNNIVSQQCLLSTQIKREPVMDNDERYAVVLENSLVNPCIKMEPNKSPDLKAQSNCQKNKRFKTETSKENLSPCYFKREAVPAESGSSDELKHKPAYSTNMRSNMTKRDVLCVLEDYLYLESMYLHFSENGEKFACTLCPTEYLSHGLMLSHLLGSKHMNTLWSSKQTSVSLIEKIEKLSQLVPLMRSGWISVFGKYNPSMVLNASKRLESLLQTLVKRGFPCCPTKLHHVWYLSDCIIDTAASDGQIQNYIPRQKLNVLKSGELPPTNQKIKLERESLIVSSENSHIVLKKEL